MLKPAKPFTNGSMVKLLAPLTASTADGCMVTVAQAGQLMQVQSNAGLISRGTVVLTFPGRAARGGRGFLAMVDHLQQVSAVQRQAVAGDIALTGADVMGVIPGQGFKGYLVREGEFVRVDEVANGWATCRAMHGNSWPAICRLTDLTPYETKGGEQ